MKKLCIFLVVVLVGTMFSFKPKKDAPLEVYEWNEGYTLAAKKKKLLLVDIYTTWCGWCARMDRDTYSDKDIINLLNKDFVFVKLNPERTDKTYKIDTMSLNGPKLMHLLTNGKRMGFPTTVIVDPKTNNIIYAESGYQDAAQFRKSLQGVLNYTANKN